MIAISPCPDATLMWPALVGETLDPEVHKHLKSCLSCRRRIQRLSAEVSQIQRLLKDPEIHLCVAPSTNTLPSSHTTAHSSSTATPMIPGSPQWELLQTGAMADAGPRSFNRRSGIPPAAVPNPDRIGRYMIQEMLGRGAQGTVYRGTHPNLGQSVVVKWAHDRISESPDGTDRLIREGRILAAIHHPALVRVIDLDVDQDRPFLVFEDCAGLPMTTYVQLNDVTLDDIIRIVGEISRGLAVVHDAGVLHLDLKPENILIQANGQPKLIDFGIAWITRSLHREGQEDLVVAGTPEYMAPEQSIGDRSRWDQRTDLYGLGGVLRFLLNATEPPELEDVAGSHLAGTPCSVENSGGQHRADTSPERFQPAIVPLSGAEDLCRDLISLPTRLAEDRWTKHCETQTHPVDKYTLKLAERRVRLRQLSDWATQQSPADRPKSAGEFAAELEQLSQRSRKPRQSLMLFLFCLLLPTLLIAAVQWRFGMRQRGELRVITTSEIDIASGAWAGETLLSDCARIEAEVPQGASGTLYLLVATGRVVTLGTVDAESHAPRIIRFPDTDQSLSLGSDGGTQVFVIGMRHDGEPPQAEQLQQVLAVCPWEIPSDVSLLKFDRLGILNESSSSLVSRNDDLVHSRREGVEQLRDLLSQQFDDFTAVIVNRPPVESWSW